QERVLEVPVIRRERHDAETAARIAVESDADGAVRSAVIGVAVVADLDDRAAFPADEQVVDLREHAVVRGRADGESLWDAAFGKNRKFIQIHGHSPFDRLAVELVLHLDEGAGRDAAVAAAVNTSAHPTAVRDAELFLPVSRALGG